MAPKYKLTYFDIKALGEPIRMLFSYANVEFEDERISFENWPKLKPQMPWNVMPVLEEDGKQLCQSLTIFRYLGRKFGLAGADDFQTAKCNEYIDAVSDVRLEVSKVFKESDETKKVELKKTAKEVTLPKTWKKLNEILKKNGTGVLVGNAVTYADIYVACMVEWISVFFDLTDMAEYPEIMAHRSKILGSPGIKEWIEKRPATQF